MSSLTLRVGAASIFLVAACGGEPEGRDSGAGDGGADAGTVDCSGLEDGTPCGDGRVCVDSTCAMSRCGDGVLDGAAGEECDDGNETAFDGCNPDCQRTCVDDSECDDGNPCNGDNTCDVETSVCESGEPLPLGFECTTSTGASGVCNDLCVEAGCGNGVVEGSEECDDEQNGDDADGCTDACEHSCEVSADCSDGDVCTGIERCDPETHACVGEDDVVCAVTDTCHRSECDPVLGCLETLIDEDGDGHAPTERGACGDDCNDLEPTVFTGAEEICDALDNNCVNGVNETAPSWFADCDGDGFAASEVPTIQGCDEPPAAMTGCATATPRWTTRRPVGTATTDCDDADASILPTADEVPGDERDQNCDGAEVCYLDEDGDGFRRPDDAPVSSSDVDCTDAREARASEPATDCNDDEPDVHPGAEEIVGDERDQDCDGGEVCFIDADGDRFRAVGTVTSADLDCDDGEETEADGTIAGDCCDVDRAVRPGTTAYSSVPTACSDPREPSFDFNCDGVDTPRYGRGRCGLGSSCATAAVQGFEGVVPQCGEPGSFITGCNYNVFTQACTVQRGLLVEQECR